MITTESSRFCYILFMIKTWDKVTNVLSSLSLFSYQAKPNAGSRARDLFASERTFLSWLRTGLASITMGLAFGKLLGSVVSKVVGALLVSMGAFLIVYSGQHYYFNIYHIERGETIFDRIRSYLFVGFLSVIALCCFVLLFVDTEGFLTR
ncbi:hypothetical protein GpartN1_g5615.t1 [Galdieria partita]|uniref:DUF202 domain-containing protein n=1 Tax=Galdieria partita TaxID=83374 RepID=A0A9C7US78_9RHOD|nr:hypothetical protein GpartN1_g5615.t1 [Galdieria partita]